MSADVALSTVERLLQLAQHDAAIANFLERKLANTYPEFLDILFTDLLIVIAQLERNPQVQRDQSEDETTLQIVNMLQVMGYSAHHNSQAGGNVDLTVEITAKGFRWIAEAKKFGSVGDLSEGYLQLSTRYRPELGIDGVLHGGLLAYLRRPNAAQCVAAWRTHIATLPVAAGCALEDCPHRGRLGFISTHAHQDYGLPLRVWHVCAVLHFAPADKSGRKSAQRRKARRHQGL